ncbi:MAG: hypothetical protein K5905_08770 [Roseibium sp.]|uniref:RT0821/Lpp0805 family surface protein n=1 Tax=Roseibium sp. TaxID=1936156 RepID=UPI00263254D0|nr:RT0821/Lpp0805 family surface protein [Roseibium sp.]MCV0425553.1 hypothetical protein [Roseibium sp.]
MVSLSDEPSLPLADKSLADLNLQTALEKSMSGKSVHWQNPDSGTSGSVTPLKTWKTAEGTFCRAYRENFQLISGRTVSRDGVACRTADAIWKST